MIYAIATFALVALPFVLDLYFSSRDSEPVEEEYIPDGR